MEKGLKCWSKHTEQIHHFKDRQCLNWRDQFVTYIFLWDLLWFFWCITHIKRDIKGWSFLELLKIVESEKSIFEGYT